LRPTIAWDQRRRAFENVAAHARSKSSGYDCVIPVSGGKDSTWQTVKCLEFGLRPLCVTWRPPGRTALGERNLRNLVSIGVDHIDYSINPEVERRFMLKTLKHCGSPAIPMHLALFSIPLRIAERFSIPLVVWGENSAFEYGSADQAHTGFQMDDQWLKTYGVTQGTTAGDWIDRSLTAGDLTAYIGPSPDELSRKGILAVFLGYYFPWDPEMTCETALTKGFTPRKAGPRTGYYNYADIDDAFISIHHYLKWYKFGFTRLFDNLSIEIRNGRMSRNRAIKVIADAGEQVPMADIDRFCDFTHLSPDDFWIMVERFRNQQLWRQRPDGTWWIPDFLIPDWQWR
jgi:N-acetyl sugar amidotransferase